MMRQNPFRNDVHLLPSDGLLKVGVLKKLTASVSQTDLNKYISVPQDLWRFIQPGECLLISQGKQNKEVYLVDNNIGINNSLTLCRNIEDSKTIHEQSMETVTAIHTKFSIQSILIIRLLKQTKDKSDERIGKLEKDMQQMKVLLRKKILSSSAEDD